MSKPHNRDVKNSGEETAQAGPWDAYLLWAVVAVMLAGGAIGVLMTWHHELFLFGEVEGDLMGCESTEEVNCDVVNSSSYAEFFGVPVAAWGFATYLTLAILAVLAWRGRRDAIPLLLAAGVATALYSVFLYYISKSQLGYVCTWCLRLYIVDFALLGLALGLKGWRKPWPTLATLGVAVGAFVALSVVAIAGDRILRAYLLADATGVDLSVDLAPGGKETETEEIELDPEGPCPVRTLQITTEDGDEVELTTRPDDAWRGNPEAAVVVIEFSDLQCGYCKRLSSQLVRLYTLYGDRVLFIAKSFAMDPACNPGVKNRSHRYACRTERALECARRQGRFWAFHGITFKNQHQLGDDSLRLYATKAELDLSDYDRCLASEDSLQAVVADGEDGKALHIHGTPRMYINGKLYRGGRSAEQIARVIELELGASPIDAAAASQALRVDRDAVETIPDDVPAMRSIQLDTLSFQIDTFEAALVDGTASSGKHEIPATRTSWYEARDACAKAGKRLCTEREWLAACHGALPVDDDEDGSYADDMVEGRTYPYGDYHERTNCWDGKKGEQFRPVYTGEMPGCVSCDGVYDLTGNVEEWVGATPETAALMGGAFDTSKDHARCNRFNDRFGPGYANHRTGFRCCGDLQKSE